MPNNIVGLVLDEGKVLVVNKNGIWKFPKIGIEDKEKMPVLQNQFVGLLGGVPIELVKKSYRGYFVEDSKAWDLYEVRLKGNLENSNVETDWVDLNSVHNFSPETREIINYVTSTEYSPDKAYITKFKMINIKK